MIKRFNTTEYPVLSSIIDTVEASLLCTKFRLMTNRINVDTVDNIKFIDPVNKELAEKGFGAHLTKSYECDIQDIAIIINMRNCITASLTEREITAVAFHELGHILNKPELEQEPTFNFCFNRQIKFNRELLENVQASNCIKMEVFADSYANRHGYGAELISTFHKQNKYFEQKIEYCAIRIERIQKNEFPEGKIMTS